MQSSSEQKTSYFVHPKALVESTDIGEGTRVWAFAHVMPGAVVGKRCNIGDHSFIESNVKLGDGVTVKNGVAVWDCVTLEDDVFVGPNAVFTNDMNPRAAVKKGRDEFFATKVRRGATIGANATIVCGVELGVFCFIGAGTVVTRNVPDYALVVGNPARQVGYMCECGKRIPETLECSCGLKFSKSGEGLQRR